MIRYLITKPLYVLAGTYDQAKDFAHRRGVSPREFVYVDREDRIKGVERGSVLFLTGTWDQRPDLKDILAAAATRGFQLLEYRG